MINSSQVEGAKLLYSVRETTEQGEIFMQNQSDPDDYELRDEYDLSKMTIAPKGRNAPERRAGKNVVLLEPDVVQAFPTDEAVNEALRLVMEIVKISGKYRPEINPD